MSASDFWKCIETQRNIYGNAYAWLDVAKTGRNAGRYLNLPVAQRKGADLC